MIGFKKLLEFETAYGADSVEWCPVEGHEDVFVCGTYELAETENSAGPQTRIGKLYLFRLGDALPQERLEPVQVLDTPGVLDSKWAHRPVQGRVLLAVADALGCLVVYQLKSSERSPGLEELTRYEVDRSPGEDLLCLSLDWSTGLGVAGSQEVRIVLSDTSGTVTVLQLSQSHLRVQFKVRAHEHQAWIAAFDYWNTHVFCSGGDDAKMNMFDTRMCCDRAIVSNMAHSAGVTSMHSSSTTEHAFLTGSYDEEVRYWDTRSLKWPVSGVRVGGGVWRLKWEPAGCPRSSGRVLAACMHSGFCLIDPPASQILCRYQDSGHESLAYGADWSHLRVPRVYLQEEEAEESNARLTAQCSFYDRKLSIALINSSSSYPTDL